MMKLTRSALIGLVFLAGCAVGGVSSQFVVPKASAQNVQRWDYLCFEEWEPEPLQAKLKRAGAEGWELAASTNMQAGKPSFCFKRPM